MNLPGLNHQLGDDIDALRDAVRHFVDKELTPIAADIERENNFPAAMWKKLG
ncbi:acyl-CoA dehydrogenase family protein, partial [Alkalihalobacillus clausii]|uniref:acyl-CoA dehydrogenase family protein n=1 Tax=Shouchella clausii TaxID=79880 RepID=UPI001C0C1271|nr:acyl-CoA dehydrogenase family protein [Shouchella clausii]